MEFRTILINDIPTEIRPMGEDYIVGEDPDMAGVEYAIKCWHPGRAEWSTEPMAAYFRKITKAYGASAITAWQGKTLVGFLPFMPVDCGMPEMIFCLCAAEQTPLEKVIAAEPVLFDKLNPKALKVQCASLAWNRNMYRKGVGSAMAACLVDWARENGWERIEGWAFAEADFCDAYRWIPSIQFWQKSGFVAKTTRKMDMGKLGSAVAVNDFELIL